MHTIDLNCDMAEGFNNEALLMPYISSANIACGYHAGNKTIMQRTVELALVHHVAIGAHPGFADKANFGRTEMKLSPAEVYDLVAKQVYLLQKIADRSDAKLHHVKPHGALYNMSAKDPVMANTIAQSVFDIDPALILFGLSGSYSVAEAKRVGLKTASEVFADRTYWNDGSLTPRSYANAVIGSDEKCVHQVLQMIEQQTVTSISGKHVPILAETICLHGDGAHAVNFAAVIYKTLQKHFIQIEPVQH